MSSLIDLIVTPESGEAAAVPPIPESIEDAGIPRSIIEHLILKYLYFRGELVGHAADALTEPQVPPPKSDAASASASKTSAIVRRAFAIL